MLSLAFVVLKFALALLAFALFVLAFAKALAFASWERQDAAREEVGHPAARAGVSKVQLTLRRLRAEHRTRWMQRGTSQLLLST